MAIKPNTQTLKAGTIYSPDLAAQRVAGWVDRQYKAVQEGNMLKWGVPILDEESTGALPIYGGRMVVILGRPGNGKSTILQTIAKTAARQFMGSSDDVILYGTFEQTPEELDLAFTTSLLPKDKRMSISDIVRGKIQKSGILPGLMERTKLPIWYYGSSADDEQPPDLEGLVEAVVRLRALGKKIRGVFVDYAQNVPVRSSGRIAVLDERQSTTIVLNTLKRSVADTFYLPVVVAAQARREVDLMALPVPGMSDGQHTSSLEQIADVLLSVMKPDQYAIDKLDIGKNNHGSSPGTYTTNPNTCLLVFAKQRQARGVGKYVLHMDWDSREMFEQVRDGA